MAIKFIILCGLLAVALGFTLPEHHYDGDHNNELQRIEAGDLLLGDEVLVRQARSPQRKFEANTQYHSRFGTSANIGYTHPLSKNFEAYGGASRNFKFNDNSGHVGFRYKF